MRLDKNKSILFIGLVFLFQTTSVFAGGYTTKELIPGEAVGSNDFMTYLNSFYNFGIAISALLAVFMIGFGAFKYVALSAGNASTMSDAKETVYSAIFGLTLALIAWLILYVINPDLVNNSMTTIPTIKDCTNPANCK